MSIASRFKIESKGIFGTSIFYAVAGVLLLIWLPLASFPPHLAIVGILSLVTAYGVIRKRAWTIWFVLILFFVATTFSAFTIYYIISSDYILGTVMIAYLVLTWIFSIYMTSKRKMFET